MGVETDNRKIAIFLAPIRGASISSRKMTSTTALKNIIPQDSKSKDDKYGFHRKTRGLLNEKGRTRGKKPLHTYIRFLAPVATFAGRRGKLAIRDLRKGGI